MTRHDGKGRHWKIRGMRNLGVKYVFLKVVKSTNLPASHRKATVLCWGSSIHQPAVGLWAGNNSQSCCLFAWLIFSPSLPYIYNPDSSFIPKGSCFLVWFGFCSVCYQISSELMERKILLYLVILEHRKIFRL